jgi:hypothetical protein
VVLHDVFTSADALGVLLDGQLLGSALEPEEAFDVEFGALESILKICFRCNLRIKIVKGQT